VDQPIDHVGSGPTIGAIASIRIREQGRCRIIARPHLRATQEAFV
jgi:hypothetical protein